ncbi:hypothetical protein DSM106972_052100 [Dulcicalothrix desertica PCC 7102]|uniref:Uncharacterized protein n=1 Tax=Dulcicalothrix desertica PCC 7102 TaxID=232991 RepID=A0A3S1CIY2_9CYAN|nr:hypothetical protein [Dulcicalothrix desertica]RUT03571.1 hypothetical protein DSM106972_052100 [Dulcicalothrix desertica PCC 7102]TWH50506.1 hypothetical protein CAL7102_04827 [Dulcicalothrix desertica PCC 7102]
MQVTKLFTAAVLGIGILSTAILPAMADKKFDNFKKNQLAQFKGDSHPETCKEKTITRGSLRYDLCQHKGKPAYIRITDDGTPISFYEFKNRQLVQSCSIDAFICSGYKNNRLVAIWNLEAQTVDFNVSSESNREIETSNLAEAKKALRIFGYK